MAKHTIDAEVYPCPSAKFCSCGKTFLGEIWLPKDMFTPGDKVVITIEKYVDNKTSLG